MKPIILTCKVCGHNWLLRRQEPLRCANNACRARRWRTGIDGRRKKERAK